MIISYKERRQTHNFLKRKYHYLILNQQHLKRKYTNELEASCYEKMLLITSYASSMISLMALEKKTDNGKEDEGRI
jgi:butyrate kinase